MPLSPEELQILAHRIAVHIERLHQQDAVIHRHVSQFKLEQLGMLSWPHVNPYAHTN